MENRFGLTEMTEELANDILPMGIDLPKNQKSLLATLMYINGIDKKDENGFFYVENKYLMNVLKLSEPTIIANANKLIEKGLIVRLSGKKHHPSKYNILKDTLKKYTKDFSKTKTLAYQNFSLSNDLEINELNDTLKKYTKDFSKNFSLNFSKNFSQDKDIEEDKELEEDKEKDKNNNINKIIEKIDIILNLLIIILKEKGSFTMSNLPEKENPSVEISTLMETITSMQENFKQQIEELKQENARLNRRLDNAAKCVKSLQCEIESLKQNNPSTENNTSTEEKPSTEANGIPFSKTSMEEQTNNPTLASVHTEEENPTDEFDLETELALDSIFGKEDKSTEEQNTSMQENPSSEKTDNNPTEERTTFQVEGTNQNENNSSTNEIFDLNPSNEVTLTVAHTDRENALEAKEMPLNAISEQSLDKDKETNNTSTEDENGPNARYFKFGHAVIKECCALNHSKCMSDLYDREKEMKDHYRKLFKDGKIDDVELKIASLAINDAKEKVVVKILNSAYRVAV